VEEHRHVTNIKVSKGGDTFAKRFDYYKVWDERKRRIPFDEIALHHKKSRTEPLGKARERVKKQFYKACELITGKKYDSEQWRKNLFLSSESKQEHLLLPKGVAEYGGVDNSLFADPQVNLLINDIINSCCKKCVTDPKCRDAILAGHISKWECCPDAMSFIPDFLSPKTNT
jgi:hypothetical protein